MRRIVIIGLLAIALAGCGARAVRAPVVGNYTTEQIARGVLEKLSAFIGAAKKNHPECSAGRPEAKLGICPDLHRAIDVNNRLADGINLYCSGAPIGVDKPYAAGGPCSPLLGAEASLNSILAQALTVLSQQAGLLQSSVGVSAHPRLLGGK